MHPHPEGRSDFKYPPGGLLQVRGVVKDDEIRKPQHLDANGEKCLIVVKHGKTTGSTLGRLNGIESFVRRYCTLSTASRRRRSRSPSTLTATRTAPFLPPATLAP